MDVVTCVADLAESRVLVHEAAHTPHRVAVTKLQVGRMVTVATHPCPPLMVCPG